MVCVYIMYTDTVEYYSAIKNNEILPLAATWMGLENTILGEISQTEKDKYYITYMWNLKDDTNKCIYKTETDSQTQKTNFWLRKRRGRGGATN